MNVNLTLLQRSLGLLLLCFSVSLTGVQAQMRVGQPSGSPDPSSALDVSGGPYANGSAYRGIAPPKVALTQTSLASPIMNPTSGLLVYNTAQSGDVTPGYYYWEGSKWLRFTTASAGAARVAANGQNIPAYLISDVANFNSPDIIYLAEPGREGMFRYVSGSTAIVDSAMALNASGGRYQRILTDGTINVKWFGAKGDGSTNDAPAIQAAVNYAKNYVTNQIATVLIPQGLFVVNATINATNTDGLWIKGETGRRTATTVIGRTSGAGKQGIVFDFAGAAHSGIENLTISSDKETPNFSTIGVLFALASYNIAHGTDIGGINCQVRNCEFRMANDVSPIANKVNNGLGTICILNSRAEEFTASDCILEGNLGAIFTSNPDLSDTTGTYYPGYGTGFKIKSDFTTVVQSTTANPGSMGVVNFVGQTSFLGMGKNSPALILDGVNTFNLDGVYFGRSYVTGSNTGPGTNDASIVIGGPANFNINISATIESYQTVRIRGNLYNSTINIVASNLHGPFGTSLPEHTPALFDISGCTQLVGNRIGILAGNGRVPQFGNRSLLYNKYGALTLMRSNEFSTPILDSTSSSIANGNLVSTMVDTEFKVINPFRTDMAVKKLTVTDNLYLPHGSASKPALRFVDSATGMYMGDNGVTGFRGPDGSSTVSSFLFGTYGNNELTLDATNSSSYSRINFSIGGAKQWVITNGSTQDFYISKAGLSSAPFVISPTGLISLGPTMANSFSANTGTITGPGNTNSQVKIGTSSEIQNVALGNTIFSDNVYFNGTSYVYRNSGNSYSMIQLLNGEVQFKGGASLTSFTAGAQAATSTQFKVMPNGTFAAGQNMSSNSGNLTGAGLIYDGPSNRLSLAGVNNRLIIGKPLANDDGVNNLQLTGNAKISGVLQHQYKVSNTNPTSSDIPEGFSQLWRNSATNEIRWWTNFGGNMYKGPAFVLNP